MTTDSGRMTPEARITEAPRRRSAKLMPIVIAASVMAGATAAWLGLPLLSTPTEVESLVTTDQADGKLVQSDVVPESSEVTLRNLKPAIYDLDIIVPSATVSRMHFDFMYRHS